MNITFEVQNKTLSYYFPDGTPFISHRQERLLRLEERGLRLEETERAAQEAKRADEEAKRADEEAKRADEAEKNANVYKKMLIELGIDPDSLIN